MTRTIPNRVDLPLKPKAARPISRGNHLLLISDAPERLQFLTSAFAGRGVDTTTIASAEELSRNHDASHDLAIVDVAPEQLAEVLKTLRENERHTRIPVLVERSRLEAERSLASVLPAYRAMPCSLDEMLTLARRSLGAATPPSAGRRQVL
jgi:DNA-binding response OmpR family regulator